MSSPFGDDAQFPGRPNHLDFWRLSDVVLQQDGAMQENKTEAQFRALVDEHIDLDSAAYMAQQRAAKLCDDLGAPRDPMLLSAVTAAFLTGVVAGISFEKKGGRR